MRQFDERVKLPKTILHLIFVTFGVSGLVLMIKGEAVNDYTDSILLLAGGIFSACATYGIACLIFDFRTSKSWADLWIKVKSKFQINLNDNRGKNK